MDRSDKLGNLDGVAIIGMAGRFPGARNVDEFWENLQNGVESISFFSDSELEAAGVAPGLIRSPSYVKASPVLDDVELFDASFFECSATEAQFMDPEHRLFLECAWEALERSGYCSENYAGAIGVYAGAGSSSSSYLLSEHYLSQALNGVTGSLEHLGNDKDYLATRASYKLNLTGPSITVQTACSTSLVAVHMACQSLLNGECDMALAGGSSVRFPHRVGYLLDREIGLVSPDGHCRAFDATGRGTVFGSGVGIVVLKRLSEAIADRDCIHGAIKGSAINNDGAQKISYTASSVEGKAKAIAEALAVADFEPETIGYVEASATGTALGDKSEVDALTQVFRAGTDKKGFCAIGSVKTNVGHLEAAAGVTGLIKTVLALEHERIPPLLHFEKPNPQIDFANSPFYINTAIAPWPKGSTPRRAGVTALGFGGTNAHIVLEEAPALEPIPNAPERPVHLLNLSAKTETALRSLAARFEQHLASHSTANLGDISLTTQLGRSHFKHRLAVAAESPVQARERLEAFVAGEPAAGVFSDRIRPARARKVTFLFREASPQIDTGRQLYETQPTFRKQMAQCNALLQAYLKRPLLPLLYPELFATEPQPAVLAESPYARAASFTIAYALAELWQAWGVRPTVVLGQGVGEYAAACTAGLFSLETGIKLLARELGCERSPVEALGEIGSPTDIEILSQEDGKSAISRMATPEYWENHSQQPQQLEVGVKALQAEGDRTFVEMGPRPPSQVSLAEEEEIYLPSLHPERSDWQQLLEGLAQLYVRGVAVDWLGFNQDYPYRRVPLPTYPFERQRYWIDPPAESAVAAPQAEPARITAGNGASAVRAHSSGDYAAPTDELERRIVKIWQDALGIQTIGIQDRFFDLGGDSMKGLRVVNKLQDELGEIVHISALFDAPTIAELATYFRKNYPEAAVKMLGLDVEQAAHSQNPKVDADAIQHFRQLRYLLPPRSQEPEAKNPPAVFILSPPRSGSTLLRAILAGHPQLFAPPELHLLSFWTLVDRKAAFSERNSFWLEGSLRALMQIRGCDAEEARSLMQELEERQLTTQQFYRWMQQQIPDRILVDKTPFYALDLKMLERAETEFEKPLYIHLRRHPGGMIRSYEKAKLDLLGQFGGEGTFPRNELAELIWLTSHQNILEFLGNIPRERQYSLQFEDLVRHPSAKIAGICQFLDLEVCPDMMNPYKNKERRMTDGVQTGGRMIGDVKFHQHRGIEATVADSWRQHFDVKQLGNATKQLAESFGYDVGENSFDSRGKTSDESPNREVANKKTKDLVPIQGNGTEIPLFLFEGAMIYQPLSRCLGLDRPVYGLIIEEKQRRQTQFACLEDLAAYYISLIKSVRPNGPYLLGGLSNGGLVAFEVAQQLLASGQTVALLALFDTIGQGNIKTPSLFKRLTYGFRQTLEAGPSYILGRTKRRAENLYARIALKTPLFRIKSLEHVLPKASFYKRIRDYSRSYVPKSYPARITFFAARETLYSGRPDVEPGFGWSQLAAGGLEMHEIPGDHLSILKEPHVRLLAEKLSSCIDNALALEKQLAQLSASKNANS